MKMIISILITMNILMANQSCDNILSRYVLINRDSKSYNGWIRTFKSPYKSAKYGVYGKHNLNMLIDCFKFYRKEDEHDYTLGSYKKKGV